MLQATSFIPPPLEHIGRLTTDQYFEMIKDGRLPEGAPYELLDGLLVLKDRSASGGDLMTVGSAHIMVVGKVFSLDRLMGSRGCFVQSQGPIIIPPLQAPEPDGAIVKGIPEDYPDEPPHAKDASCVIEVSDSSLRFDRYDKSAKYAEAKIPQYVLINLVEIQIEIYERPDPALRTYMDRRIVKSSESIPFLLPDGTRLEVPVDTLLPAVIRHRAVKNSNP